MHLAEERIQSFYQNHRRWVYDPPSPQVKNHCPNVFYPRCLHKHLVNIYDLKSGWKEHFWRLCLGGGGAIAPLVLSTFYLVGDLS